jgi:hypothetical protein
MNPLATFGKKNQSIKAACSFNELKIEYLHPNA